MMAICCPSFIWPKDGHPLLKGPIDAGFCPFSSLPSNLRRCSRLIQRWVALKTPFLKFTLYHSLTHAQVLERSICKFKVGHLSVFRRFFDKFLNLIDIFGWKRWTSTTSFLGRHWSAAKRVTNLLSRNVELGCNFWLIYASVVKRFNLCYLIFLYHSLA